MSDFYTSFLCPWKNIGLDFISPCPLDLDGAYAILARPDLTVATSTGEGGPLRFSCDVYSMVHRNWKPYSWDCVGTVSGSFFGSGYVAAPGPMTVGNPLISDDYEGSIDVEVEELSEHTTIQPDFSFPTPQRKMIRWGVTDEDGEYPQPLVSTFGTGIHPVYVDPEGNNPTGWYIAIRATITAVFEPYLWSRDGNFYLEQTVSVEWSVYASPDAEGSTGTEGWNPLEGTTFTGFGGIMTGQQFGLQESVGEIQVIDVTGIDPNPTWGTLNLYSGNTEGNASLTFRVKSNYLPHPGYA